MIPTSQNRILAKFNLRKACILLLQLNYILSYSQNASWTLWASGLPSGVYPKMTISANHDIYYTLVGTGTTPGVVYKSNTQSPSGIFTAMPAIPLPSSHQNNVQCIITNQHNELIAGIFRTDLNDPWLFRFDQSSQTWRNAAVDINPALGAFCMAASTNGTIWVGAKWSWVYKSTDNGNTFQRINENISIKTNYPCYYPSWFNVDNDGAIYGINVDETNRVYAGTESAGVIYSDDEGLSWQPADVFTCQTSNQSLKDSNSVLHPLTLSGNVSGFGFTADNKLIWTGAALWSLGWKNGIACADLKNNIIYPAKGLPDYLVQYGQQVTKIVTTRNGQIFFHSGSSNGATGIGIYTSLDGINWHAFNNGITGANDGQSQGSLAVDGNQVYFATHDGKVWKYDAEITGTQSYNNQDETHFYLYPNPISNELIIESNSKHSIPSIVTVYNLNQQKILESTFNYTSLNVQNAIMDLTTVPDGLIYISIKNKNFHSIQKMIVQHSVK